MNNKVEVWAGNEKSVFFSAADRLIEDAIDETKPAADSSESDSAGEGS